MSTMRNAARALDTLILNLAERLYERSAPMGVRLVVIGLILLVVGWNAFVHDDAWITYRVLDNFVNGYGLRFNIDERVQAFTHPLWLFLHVPFYLVIEEPHWISIGLSVACVGGALFLAPVSVLLLPALILSGSFVHWSTSGLENPLTVLLLAWFAREWFGSKRPKFLFLIAALAGVNRLDTLLFYLPALAISRFRIRDLVALAPLVLWELFSLVYYGSLFPNTAYAKLPDEEPWFYATHGVQYLVDFVQSDLVGLWLVVAGLLAPIARRDAWPISMGILLYIGYVVYVGGCYMSLRFFMPAVVASVCCLPEIRKSGRPLTLAVVAMLLLSTLSFQAPRYLQPTGIADSWERAWEIRSLQGWLKGRHPNEDGGAQFGKKNAGSPMVTVSGSPGMPGFYHGPEGIYIDVFGLTEPLLSRLPPRSPGGWRIGHARRSVPEGYMEFRTTGFDELMSKELREFHRPIRIVTRDPIWSIERGKAILEMNLGYRSYKGGSGVQ